MKKNVASLGIFLVVVGVVVSVFSLVLVPFSTTEPYQVPRSKVCFDYLLSIPLNSPTRYVAVDSGGSQATYLKKGDVLNIKFYEVDSKDINFYIRDNEVAIESYYHYSSYNSNYTLPEDGYYTIRFDNPYGSSSDRTISLTLTRYWTQTDYREVTEYRFLIPFQCSYAGVVVLVVGVAIAIWGIVAKEVPLSVSGE